ncbi:hypothetical protein ACNKHP_20850 [Shigella boydii]
MSIGYLVSKIDSWRSELFMTDGSVFVVREGSDVAVGGSWPAHIRSADDGHGAKKIARVVRQQEALFSSVYEGLIAVDPVRLHYRHQS